MQIEGQSAFSGALLTAATAVNASPPPIAGVFRALYYEIAEGNTGTATVNLEGSFDGTNWYAVGYQQIDGVAAPARAVAALAVAQNTRHVYQILDTLYPQMRARISVIAAGTITVKYVGTGV